MTQRPAPGTHEEDLFNYLAGMMSAAGRRVDFDACAQLAETIQQYGHDCGRARYMARDMGLKADYLPRRRTP